MSSRERRRTDAEIDHLLGEIIDLCEYDPVLETIVALNVDGQRAAVRRFLESDEQ